MIGELPRSVEVNGKRYAIRSDFRDILKILCACGDPELTDEEKIYVCLYVFYESFEQIPQNDYEAAYTAAMRFIDGNAKPSKSNSPRIMDWEQDESILFPALNKTAGFEIRTAEYLHWWTFLGYYMEISEGVFSSVLHIRLKKAKRKKLDKWEREYWAANKDICELKTKLSEAEQQKKDRLNAMLN